VVDVFEEVEEQLRSARYQTLAKKAWPYLLAVVVLALVATLAVWGWREHQAGQNAKASETYQQAFDALQAGDTAKAEASFAEIARDGPKGYKSLALMQQAGLLTRAGKTTEAVALLDQAAKAAPTPLLEDAARLKAAYLVFDTAPLAEIETRLTPLTETGRPFVSLAREALAMKRLAAGKVAEARTTLAALAISQDATEGMQQRAQLAMSLIDSGQAPTVVAIAKAAAALPPGLVLAPPPAAPAQPQTPQAGAPQ
jgi:hypothetical protein